MIEPIRKISRRRPRSTNTCRPEIREAIVRRQMNGESLAVRAILRETGGSTKTILDELERAGVKSGEKGGAGASRRREEALRTQLAAERQARAKAEAEAKVAREMYDDLVARIEFNLRKSEERAERGLEASAVAQPIVVRAPVMRDEVSEAKLRLLTNENGTMAKKIEQILKRLRKYEPDAE